MDYMAIAVTLFYKIHNMSIKNLIICSCTFYALSTFTGALMKKEPRTTILVSLPPETVKKLILLKVEKGMFVNRFVETVARDYVANEDIVKALYFMKDGDGFSRVQRSFSLPASLLDSLRAVRTVSGLSLSRILSRIVTHGLVELEEGLPFGSTLRGYVEKSDAFQSVIPGKPL